MSTTVDDIRKRHATASANEEFGEDEVGVLLAEIDRLRRWLKVIDRGIDNTGDVYCFGEFTARDLIRLALEGDEAIG